MALILRISSLLCIQMALVGQALSRLLRLLQLRLKGRKCNNKDEQINFWLSGFVKGSFLRHMKRKLL